jgi:DNA (cytosine-5)-methyltransferase 1
VKNLVILDLFSGAGGLSTGFSRVFRNANFFAVEVDRDSCKTFEANHQHSVVLNQTVNQFLSTTDLNQVDIIIGGPPCQGFSRLGKREPGDERNNLWMEYLEAVKKFNPKIFLIENVPAFLNSTAFVDLRGSLESLIEYEFDFRVLGAEEFGAPQRRKRAFIVGWQRGFGPFNWPTALQREVNLRQAIGHLPRPGEHFEWEKSSTLKSGAQLHKLRNYSELSKRRFASIPPGGNRFDLPEELKAECWKKNSVGFSDVMGRLIWEKPSVTIRTEFDKPEKGRYLHPDLDRAITHLEAALIQGFPETYKFYGNRSSIARQIGNAVPIQLAEAIAKNFKVLFSSTRKLEEVTKLSPHSEIEQ